MPRRVVNAFRRLVRALGYDVVRYNAVPADLDAAIRETIDAVRPFTMTSLPRLVTLCEAIRYVVDADIPGDIVECGVWRGGSMMAIARTLAQRGDATRTLHLFDTFRGMTEPTDKDVSILGQTADHLLAAEDKSDPSSVWCVASLDEVKRNMETTSYPAGLIRYVAGKVEDTIPAHAPARIALLRLDTDWYESTRHELQHLYSRVAQGGVLIVDDYGHWEGARKAVDEYFEQTEAKPLLQRVDYSGRLAIKVK